MSIDNKNKKGVKGMDKITIEVALFLFENGICTICEDGRAKELTQREE